MLVLLLGLLHSTSTVTVITSGDSEQSTTSVVGFFTKIVGGFCALDFYNGREKHKRFCGDFRHVRHMGGNVGCFLFRRTSIDTICKV